MRQDTGDGALVGNQIRVGGEIGGNTDIFCVRVVSDLVDTCFDDIVQDQGAFIDPDAPRLDLRHVENIGDDREQGFSAAGDIAAIIDIFRASKRAEYLVFHHFRESENGVERRSQFVAHAGKEFGFGEIGALGFGFLFEIAFDECRELLRLFLECQSRAAQIGNHRREFPLRLHIEFFLIFEGRDVGADRDIAAIARRAFIDLEPAPVRQAGLVALDSIIFVDTMMNEVFGEIIFQIRIGGADANHIGRQIVEVLKFGIAQDKLVICIPEHERLADRLDRVPQTQVCRGIHRISPTLLGNIDRNADQMRRRAFRVINDFRPRPNPNPAAICGANPESLIHRRNFCGGELVGKLEEIAVIGMDEAVDIAKREYLALPLISEHVIHRVRPIDRAPCNVPVP